MSTIQRVRSMSKTFEVGGKTFTVGEEMRYEFHSGSYLKVTVIGPWGTTDLSAKCRWVACWFAGRVISCDYDRLSPIPPPTIMVELTHEQANYVGNLLSGGWIMRQVAEACREALAKEAGEA